jgi:hypothetical protein
LALGLWPGLLGRARRKLKGPSGAGAVSGRGAVSSLKNLSSMEPILMGRWRMFTDHWWSAAAWAAPARASYGHATHHAASDARLRPDDRPTAVGLSGESRRRRRRPVPESGEKPPLLATDRYDAGGDDEVQAVRRQHSQEELEEEAEVRPPRSASQGSDPALGRPFRVVRPRSARPASTTREDRRRRGDVARPPERLAIGARLADNDADQRLESFSRQAARLVATRSLQEGKSP